MSDVSMALRPASTPLLGVEHLSRRINGHWLWQGVNFELNPKMRLGLIGPSGSGKTLLMRTLVGLDPIETGQIIGLGKRLSQWSLPVYRTKVIYLPQRPTLFEGSVEQNLEMVFQLSGHRGRGYNRDRILVYLDTLQRGSDFLRLSAPQLSGGEGQLLGLLRALQLDPQIFLLDEPTASLDPETTRWVETLIDQWLQADPSRACIWTSHDANQINRVTADLLNLQQFMPRNAN